MKKSDFYSLIKQLPRKPDSIAIHGKMVCVCVSGLMKQVLTICKTEENADKELHKFNRWLSEALEEIHPSEAQWMPEEDSNTITVSDDTADCSDLSFVGKIKTVKSPSGGKKLFVSAVNVIPQGGKTKIINDVIDSLGLASNIVSLRNSEEAREVKKSPEKMFVRATLNIMKRCDCFDSAKNPHWSNLNKKEKKDWARKFGIEMMECWIDACARELCSDYKDGYSSMPGIYGAMSDSEYYDKTKLHWIDEARNQLLAEMDYSSVEDYIEENLNCLW